MEALVFVRIVSVMEYYLLIHCVCVCECDGVCPRACIRTSMYAICSALRE